jgi:adenine-specific DNA-methyltransferase
MTKQYILGQYFTTSTELQEKVYSFILNKPSLILEPSMGRGDLINYVSERDNSIKFDAYEIDNTINILNKYISRDKVIFGDFLEQSIQTKYKTIIGNPPYANNLHIHFIYRCYDLLEIGGELVFIVPTNFLTDTPTSSLLDSMIRNGSFTHIYHPNNTDLFEGASVDVVVFRYCKDGNIHSNVNEIRDDINKRINNGVS